MMSTMQSFIITAKDAQKGKDYALRFCKEKNISTFDLVYVDLEKLSIGITEIKQMQKTLHQKPYNSSHKAVIITNAETLTIEAQNALLKTLEEPPEYVFIFLLANNKEIFLPTILSRCKITSLDEKPKEWGKEEQEQYETILKKLPTYSISQKLKLAQDASKTKETAIAWLENMMLATRGAFIDKEHNDAIGEKVRAFQKTHTTIKTTNVIPRFALENLLLSL